MIPTFVCGSDLEKQHKFFARWQDSCPDVHIIEDGIVSESAYSTAKLKILFLLKEVNDWGGEGTLCDFLAAGGMAQTWNNVARWTKGIISLAINAEEDIPWKELDVIDNDYRKEQLRKICAVNIKKTSGGSYSVFDELTDFVDSNKERLRQQLEICDPDIIICCGTAWHYKRLMETDAKWDATSRGIPYIRERKRLVVDYCHPQARMSSAILYYSLIDAIRNIGLPKR